MKKYFNWVLSGALSGVFLCVGCTVKIMAGGTIGALLFSLGLFAIITFGLGLYTGRAGYMAINPPSYIIEVLFTLIGNFVGSAIGGTLLRLTRFGESLTGSAAEIIDAKIADGALSIIVLSIFCGMLMFTAVEGCKRLLERKNFTGALFIVVVPVMVFIICGFNHSIADMGYFFISGCSSAAGAPLYFLLAILGNAIGCMALPFAEKLMRKGE